MYVCAHARVCVCVCVRVYAVGPLHQGLAQVLVNWLLDSTEYTQQPYQCGTVGITLQGIA